MSKGSKIEWTDATWNPVTGCTKVSPGCAHCYAERITERFHGPGSFEKIVLHPERLGQPLHWKKPRRVFVNSVSDLFHEAVPDEFINRCFTVMAAAPQHTFQILTKRPARMLTFFDHSLQSWLAGPLPRTCVVMDTDGNVTEVFNDHLPVQCWPLPNVWLGVSVENQHFADERIPLLLQTPASVRFVSAEPLLGELHIERFLSKTVAIVSGCIRKSDAALGWVICGGESGPGARPMHPGWARALRDQCVDAGVPFFFKQWGEWSPVKRLEKKQLPRLWAGSDGSIRQKELTCEEMKVIAENLKLKFYFEQAIVRCGKKRSGSLLDGFEWDEFPKGA